MAQRHLTSARIQRSRMTKVAYVNFTAALRRFVICKYDIFGKVNGEPSENFRRGFKVKYPCFTIGAGVHFFPSANYPNSYRRFA